MNSRVSRNIILLVLIAGIIMLASGCNSAAVDRTLFGKASMRPLDRGISVDLAGEIGSGFASGGGAAAACGG